MRIMIGAAGIAAAAGAAMYAYIVHAFFNQTIERECRIFRNKFGKGSIYENTILEGEDWLNRQQKEAVEITSFDGLKLRGYYFRSEKAVRTVLMFHGWRGQWNYDFAPSARWFYEQGCNLLIVEERAQGKSEGKYMGFGILERKDCRDWIQKVIEMEKGQFPLYLYGVSMGASTVLMAAGEPLPGQVKGLIADCGFTSPCKIVERTGRKSMKFGLSAVMKGLNLVCKKRAGFRLDDYTTLDALQYCQTPILFVHGTGDRFVPSEMTRENYDACQSKKWLLLVEGASHCMSFLYDREAYTQAVEELWKETKDDM